MTGGIYKSMADKQQGQDLSAIRAVNVGLVYNRITSICF